MQSNKKRIEKTKFFTENLISIHVLPTPELPMSNILNKWSLQNNNNKFRSSAEIGINRWWFIVIFMHTIQRPSVSLSFSCGLLNIWRNSKIFLCFVYFCKINNTSFFYSFKKKGSYLKFEKKRRSPLSFFVSFSFSLKSNFHRRILWNRNKYHKEIILWK